MKLFQGLESGFKEPFFFQDLIIQLKCILYMLI